MNYDKDKCIDIPKSDFNLILSNLLKDAAYKMGSSIVDNPVEFARQLIWIIETRYPELPLYKLKEAFHKGALGELGGTTKISVRNVNIWIKEISQAWNEGFIARRNRDKMTEEEISESEKADKHSAIAYALRIRWGCQHRITPAEWDFLSTQHEKMKEAAKTTKEDDMHPGMFLSGFVEPEEEVESIFGGII